MLIEKPAGSRARKPLLPADRPGALDPIPFDRRRNGRDPIDGSVMASFISDEAGITLARVELRDSSRDGIGLLCPLPFEPGTRFNLYHQGTMLGSHHGVVARCTPIDDRFSLGLRFDEQAGAAA